MNFYKNVIVHRGKLLIRGVLNGKEYQEKRMSGLRSALQARQEADKLIQEELRSMGYKQFNPIPLGRWNNLA